MNSLSVKQKKDEKYHTMADKIVYYDSSTESGTTDSTSTTKTMDHCCSHKCSCGQQEDEDIDLEPTTEFMHIDMDSGPAVSSAINTNLDNCINGLSPKFNLVKREDTEEKPSQEQQQEFERDDVCCGLPPEFINNVPQTLSPTFGINFSISTPRPSLESSPWSPWKSLDSGPVIPSPPPFELGLPPTTISISNRSM